MNSFIFVGAIFLLGLVTWYFIHAFRATGAKTYLYFGIAGSLGVLYLILNKFAETNFIAIWFLQVKVILFGFFIGLGVAYWLTVDSGKIRGFGKTVSFYGWLIRDTPNNPNGEQPAISRWQGILAGLFFLVVGIFHHLFFPWARTQYTLLFLWIGMATLFLSVMRLR